MKTFLRRSISAIIVSYNDREIMRRCLAALSAQLDVKGDEIIVVDNGSTDGVLEDLRADSRVKLIENGENAGFPVGCNIGFEAATPGNDIFLINNDAVIAEGALDNLCEALYLYDKGDETRVAVGNRSGDDQVAEGPVCDAQGDECQVGAVGAVSNNALEQTIENMARDIPLDEALKAGAEISRGKSPYEYRSRLTGFAVLIKRSVVDRLVREDGCFLDPRFSPGYFEDEDLGVRIALAGYRQILCHNAFIYHKGGTGFASHPEAMERGRQKFIDKWGFDVWAHIGILDDYEKAVEEYLSRKTYRVLPEQSLGMLSSRDLRILELDCGMGVNLAHLQYLYPGSTVIGIERDPVFARIAAQLIDVICEDTGEAFHNALTPGTPEAEYLPAGSFDIIFAWDALERSADPESLHAGLQRLLKPDGLLVDSC